MNSYRVFFDTLEDKECFIVVTANSVEEAKSNACKELQKKKETFRIKYVLNIWGHIVGNEL